MNVRVRVLFQPPTENDREAMQSLGESLTDDRQSVRVWAEESFGWLAVEFTMPTQPQYRVLSRIDWGINYHAGHRQDSAIGFPRTAEEQAQADRRSAQRKARRKLRKQQTD